MSKFPYKRRSRKAGLSGPSKADLALSDYDVFLSPLSDFKKAIEEAGLTDKVVYLDRKDSFRFKVK